MAHPQPFAPSSPPDVTGVRPWSPGSPEARLLARSLRSAPVTIVHGSAAADRLGLLTSGVLPSIGRRREDRAAPARRAKVLPFTDRRRPLGPGAAPAESVLVIDDWPGPPLQPLAERIEQARGGETPGRVLLVMINFEAALERAACAIHPDRFWPELAQGVRTRPHGLHLLLVTTDADTPALRWFGRQLPGLGSEALRLAPGVEPRLAPVPGLTGAVAPEVEPTSTLPFISEQDWLDAAQGAVERATERGEAPKVRPAAVADAPATASEPGAGPAPPPGGQRRTSRRLLPALSMAACAGLAVLAWDRWPSDGASNSTAATTGSTARSTTRSSGTVTAQLGAEPAMPLAGPAPPAAALRPPAPADRSHVDAEPASTLRGLLPGLPLLDLRADPAQTAARLAAAPQPALALVRYDTLQKLPSSAGGEGWRVVAPLFVEPIQVWVRANSPLRRLDDLARGTVDVGRNGGDVASAAGVTEALFGKSLPAARQRRLADAQALAALQRGDVDAVLRVQASPLTALATTSAADGALRTLTLDRASPAGARALREYLPAAAPTAAGDRTLGVMSFLVVRGGDAAARQRLAGDALRALCTGLPALRTTAAPGWATVRPEVQLPVGRAYALSAERTVELATRCDPVSLRPGDANPDSPTPKGTLQ